MQIFGLLIWTETTADDMGITTTSIIGASWVLKGIEKLITWERRNFNPSNSQSLVFKKGKAQENERFKLSGQFILTMQEKAIKNLGKRIDYIQRDTVAMHETNVNQEKWLI